MGGEGGNTGIDRDLELAQLLCTRLCHDLAGPIGAISAGVELIGGDPAAADPETLSLIESSSAAAALKLKFIRAALGSLNGAVVDMAGLLDGYLGAVATAGGRPAVQWPALADFAALSGPLGPSWRQSVLNLCLAALEMQPGCRELAVSVAQAPLRLRIEVKANPARTIGPRSDLETVLTGDDPGELSAKTIQAFVARRLIRAAGGTLEVARHEGGLAVTASF